MTCNLRHPMSFRLPVDWYGISSKTADVALPKYTQYPAFPYIAVQVSFAEYSLFHRALLQKRPVILRSLLFIATPYQYIYSFSICSIPSIYSTSSIPLYSIPYIHISHIFMYIQHIYSFSIHSIPLHRIPWRSAYIAFPMYPQYTAFPYIAFRIYIDYIHAVVMYISSIGWLWLVGSIKV